MFTFVAFLVDTQTPSLCQAYMHYIAPNSLSKCLVSIITIFKSSGIDVLLLAVYCVVVAILEGSGDLNGPFLFIRCF
jgi:hypothetical protein